MSGLLRRIRRPGAAAETRTEATPLPEPAHGSAPETAPVRADGSPLPAGVTPEDLALRSGAGRRGKVRRRARFLRRARELALRDLGGLVYEAHRRDQDGAKLIAEKVQHLGVIDAELRALEVELGTPRGETVLREPGVGGTCPRCGELHASDAHYCSRCGLDLTTVPVEEPTPEQAEAVPAEPAASEPAGSGEAAPSESTPAQTEAGEAAPPEQPRRDSKRWWRRRSAAASEATAAEPAASDATAAEPAASEASSAEPATTEAPAAEQPTKDLASDAPQAGNGRAATKDQAPDPDRAA